MTDPAFLIPADTPPVLVDGIRRHRQLDHDLTNVTGSPHVADLVLLEARVDALLRHLVPDEDTRIELDRQALAATADTLAGILAAAIRATAREDADAYSTRCSAGVEGCRRVDPHEIGECLGRDARRPHPDPLVEARLAREDEIDDYPNGSRP